MGSGCGRPPPAYKLVQRDKPEFALVAKYVAKIPLNGHPGRKEQILHACHLSAEHKAVPIYWSGDGVMWKAGDIDKAALEVREQKMNPDNDVHFWQSLPDSPADIITRFKLHKDGTISPTCNPGKEFVLGQGWSNRVVLVPHDSSNKIFWERVPEPSFSLVEASRKLSVKLKFVGVYADKNEERAMPDYPGIWINKEQSAPPQANTHMEPDGKVLNTVIKEMVQDIKRRGFNEGYLGIQYGARCFRTYGAIKYHEKHGHIGPEASDTNSRNELGMKLDGVDGIVNVIGGPSQNAVYKISF